MTITFNFTLTALLKSNGLKVKAWRKSGNEVVLDMKTTFELDGREELPI